MTGPEVLDVARDAIYADHRLGAGHAGGLGVGRHFAAAGAHPDPGNDPRLRAENPGDIHIAAGRAAVHGRKLHAEMLRIAARIVSG